MKTEAERRLDAFIQRTEAKFGERVSDVKRAETLALFRAIFDPLPPEPEPAKSLGQVAWEAVPGRGVWSALRPDTRNDWDRSAKAVIAAHESRRQKPTVDEVARALRVAECGRDEWDVIAEEGRALRCKHARTIFPLFGVEP